MYRIEQELSAAGTLGQLLGGRKRWIVVLPVAVATLGSGFAFIATRIERANEESPIFLEKIPSGYRDWSLISVAHEEGNLKSLGAILGNDVAIKAFREGKLPFPDGSIIAALHWRHESSEKNNKVFGRDQSFVAGSPTNVQFMVKDSKKYAATGGWGFGHFNERDGKPAEKDFMNSCYTCHKKANEQDLVFTRYSP